MKKKLLLAVAVAAAFFVGYGTSATAYPGGGVYGRASHHGYFTNSYDTSGWEVLNQYCNNTHGSYSYNNGQSNCNSIPLSVNSAASFIAFIEDRLANGAPGGTYGDTRARTGAAFIVQTMIGSSRNRPPTAGEMTTWRNLVNQYAGAGRVNWNTSAHSFNLNTFYQGTDNTPSPNDDAFYDDGNSGAAIVFYNSSGGVAYALRRECANPVGTNNIVPLTELSNFSISGRTTVSSPTVKPNTSVTFNHYVRNNGPTDTGGTNIFWIAQSMPSQAAVGGAANSGTYTNGQEKNVFNHTVNVPIGAVVGSQICERVGWDPVNSAGARDGRGAQVCSTVIPDFNLTPQVIVDKQNGSEGDQVTFSYQITSAGVTPTTSITCTPIGNNRATGYTPLPQQDVARTADAGYTAPGTSCPRTFQPNIPTEIATEVVTLGAMAPGAKLCRSLVVNPRNEAGGPRTSTETCVLIAKTPYAHFMGNDVFAGGNFPAVSATCNTQAKIGTVGRTLSDGSTAGSVAEYGAFALGQVTGFGSSSRVLIGSGTLGAAGRTMTFANSEPNVSLLGYYGQAQNCMNDYVANYASSPTLAPGAYNINTRGTGQWRVAGNLSLTGAMPAPPASGIGHQQVYYVQGDVTITGTGVTYPATYATTAAIPSLLIIATGNIYVSPTVTQMDGIFVARGNGVANGVFYTCWPKNEPASITNQCNSNLLTVNGSVIAGRIDLFRSFGAAGATAAARKDPGERFFFSPEMYIRNVLNNTSQPTIHTTNVLELPPRF
ncbi:MAG TPA: hypothetical protein VJM32_01845 [Candidatus Saccharimonadales bacterium]|nr:hypothetical protein [Candidatus Saccharimonadales bacterium]